MSKSPSTPQSQPHKIKHPSPAFMKPSMSPADMAAMMRNGSAGADKKPGGKPPA